MRREHYIFYHLRHLDQPDQDVYKADPAAYLELAEALDQAAVDAISIEDAHRPSDLRLLELFEQSTVILGLIAIAKTRVESVEEMRTRLQEALSLSDSEHLVAGPDCGLGLLDLATATSKLANLTAAAKSPRLIRSRFWADAAVRRTCPGSWGAVCEPSQRLARRSLRQIIESQHQSAVR
jgi:Cobalamin-independent synthase, Catalytic domain